MARVTATGIYEIKNIKNNKRYIGSAINIDRRFYLHILDLKYNRHYNSYLQNAWNKYGEDSFEFNILLQCDKENLLFYEQRGIDVFKSANGSGYNLTPTAGSQLGYRFTKEQRRKLSIAHIGQPAWNRGILLSEEHKLNLSLSHIGIQVSEKTKNKMSKARLGIPRTEETKQKISKSHMGIKQSEESRKKISNARKGKVSNFKGKTFKHTEEAKKKIGIASLGNQYNKGRIPWNKGQRMSEETKQKISETKRRKNGTGNF